jgi:hypothetical protein
VVLNRRLASPARRCTASIFYNFFFLQWRAALAGKFRTKRSIPVSRVDHELDALVPFNPGWINVYLDFVGFWVRMLGFLLAGFGRRAWGEAAGFLDSMGALYRFAGEIYRRNLSTTRRPFYIGRPRFLLIHLVDPHLMCIPSLHVMVVILAYTRFARIMERLGRGDSPLAGEFRQGALDITAAILYVKQHSVNCVAAALYAMTCFDGAAFPPEEAEAFVSRLFREGGQGAAGLPRPAGPAGIGEDAAALLREHIRGLYRRFLRRRPELSGWEGPLLEFLEALRTGGS